MFPETVLTGGEPNAEQVAASVPRQSGTRGRATYRPPHMVLIASADDVLEVLGPAQANYGTTAFG